MIKVKNSILIPSLFCSALASAVPASYVCKGEDTSSDTHYSVEYTEDTNVKTFVLTTQVTEVVPLKQTYKDDAVKTQAVNSLTAVSVADPIPGQEEWTLKVKTLLLPKIVFAIPTAKFKTVLILTNKRVKAPATPSEFNPDAQDGLLGALSEATSVNLECVAEQPLN